MVVTTTMVGRGRRRRRSGARARRWLHFVFVVLQFGLLLPQLGVTTCKGAETINDDNVIPSLPDESNRDDGGDDNVPIRQIKFGETVKLDELGPVIVQSDCTLKRIENWHKLTEGEREATMRRIGGRNQVRLDKCREEQKGRDDEL